MQTSRERIDALPHNKSAVLTAYREHKPIRVPVTYGVNPRVIVLDPKWNPKGITFKDYFENVDALVDRQLAFMDFRFLYLNQYADDPVGRPEKFELYVDNLNSYDSLFFGCPLHYRDGEVPDTEPILAGGNKNRLFEDFDMDHPLDNPFIRRNLARHELLKKAAAKASHHGVTLAVAPFSLAFDGHLTIATCLRGEEIYTDFYEDPDYLRKLLDFIGRAVMKRNHALNDLFGLKPYDTGGGWFADDSIQLISSEMYREFLLPLHRQWYAQWAKGGPHWIHLCGDATRHFPTIVKELNVRSFDTGFPVNHGKLRKELGPDVEILGGPEVGILLQGKPQQVYERTKAILQSGIMEGGRFILREANNLPPCVPEENLAAMYRCCLDHGNYPS
jgi:hypothetical protein